MGVCSVRLVICRVAAALHAQDVPVPRGRRDRKGNLARLGQRGRKGNLAQPGRQVRRGRAAAVANKDHKAHGAAVVNRARPAREDVRVFRVLKVRVAAGDPKVLRENRVRPARKA